MQNRVIIDDVIQFLNKETDGMDSEGKYELIQELIIELEGIDQ